MGGGADDLGDLLRIVHVRDLHQDAVVALNGHGGLGEAGVGQTGAQGGHGAVQQGFVVVHRGIGDPVLRGYAAAQIQAQADGAAHGLQDVLANLQAVQSQERHDDDQHRDDSEFDQAFNLHSVSSLRMTDKHSHSSIYHTKYYYSMFS